MEFASPWRQVASHSDGHVKLGLKPSVPAVFKQYEVGRSSQPEYMARSGPSKQSAWPRNTTEGAGKPNGPVDWMEDPTLYDPYAEFGRIQSHSKLRRPFDATSLRELAANLFSKEGPGPETWNDKAGVQKESTYTDESRITRYCFKASSPQRPWSASSNPPPGAYSPMVLDRRAKVTGGFRSNSVRFSDGRFKVMTDPNVGPGSYQVTHGTLLADAEASTRRSSKLRIAFGTTSPQCPQPFATYGRTYLGGPGDHYPLAPRVRSRKPPGRQIIKPPVRQIIPERQIM